MNEVEARGLTESGIYRVPGAEREVKDLRDRFLRGKGTPNLVSITVCMNIPYHCYLHLIALICQWREIAES